MVSLLADHPSEDTVRFLCGTQRVSFVSMDLLSITGLIRSIGFSSVLVKKMIQRSLVPLLPKGESFVVRSYGDSFAGMFAALLGELLECRSVASVHTTFTHIPVSEVTSLKGKLIRLLESKSRAFTHEHIDALAPVYSPIMASIPEKYHGKTYVVANSVAVGPEHIKSAYDRSKILKIISVGRLVAGKSVMPLLEALEGLKQWELTIVGDGPCRAEITDWIKSHDKEDLVRIVPSLKNEDLICSLKNFDVFAAHTAYAEIPKTVIEAGLVGLPIVLNEPSSMRATEYLGAPIIWVTGDSVSYRKAFEMLGAHSTDLSELGHATRNHFETVFSPELSGKMMADLILQTGNGNLRPWNKD